MLNRHFIGIDINEKYIEIARKRVEEEMRQRRLVSYSAQAKIDSSIPSPRWYRG